MKSYSTGLWSMWNNEETNKHRKYKNYRFWILFHYFTVPFSLLIYFKFPNLFRIKSEWNHFLYTDAQKTNYKHIIKLSLLQHHIVKITACKNKIYLIPIDNSHMTFYNFPSMEMSQYPTIQPVRRPFTLPTKPTWNHIKLIKNLAS